MVRLSSLERWFIVSNITRNIAQQEMTSEDVCQDFSFTHHSHHKYYSFWSGGLDHEVYVVWEWLCIILCVFLNVCSEFAWVWGGMEARAQPSPPISNCLHVEQLTRGVSIAILDIFRYLVLSFRSLHFESKKDFCIDLPIINI